MKHKFLTLFLALVASVGTLFAESGTCGDNLTWTYNNGTLTISGSGDMTNYSSYGSSRAPWSTNGLTITTVIINEGVTSVGSCAFYSCSNLTSVTIPNTVTSIKLYAFEYCTSLTSIEIPNSVTDIGDATFRGCSALTSVTIPNSVTSLGSEAFYDCRSITSVTIGSGMSNDGFGNKVFDGCNNLTSVLINSNALMSYDYSSVHYIPQLIYGIFGEQVREYIIGDGVTSIGNGAFNDCKSLTSVTIPNSVTRIGDRAFGYCYSLSSMTIPNSVTSIGENAFISCTNLSSLTIPNSVISIGQTAFYNCTALTSFSIPNPQTQCGNNILVGVQSLTSMSVPASALNISESSINSVTSHLQSLTVIGGEVSESGFLFITHSYRTLQTLDLGAATNTTLADEAFKGCYNLQSLVLPQNLTEISYMAVADCKNLQSINIPASVIEIEQSAFENCRSLKTITFGEQVANVSGRLNTPATSTSQLQKIGNWAFYNCHELQNLTIPEGVTEIGDGAFYGCTYLEDLSLPASVQSIGDNTFALCAKLQKIVVNAPVPPSIQAKTFFDVKRQIPVYVPDESISAYENDALWGEFDIQGVSQMPQGIDQVNQQQNANSQKLIKDGQILILRGDKTYTLQGQEVR